MSKSLTPLRYPYDLAELDITLSPESKGHLAVIHLNPHPAAEEEGRDLVIALGVSENGESTALATLFAAAPKMLACLREVYRKEGWVYVMETLKLAGDVFTPEGSPLGFLPKGKSDE